MNKILTGLIVTLGAVAMFVGVVGYWSATFVWIGHFIYELVKTDQGFLTLIVSNLVYWLLQMVISLVLLFAAQLSTESL